MFGVYICKSPGRGCDALMNSKWNEMKHGVHAKDALVIPEAQPPQSAAIDYIKVLIMRSFHQGFFSLN